MYRGACDVRSNRCSKLGREAAVMWVAMGAGVDRIDARPERRSDCHRHLYTKYRKQLCVVFYDTPRNSFLEKVRRGVIRQSTPRFEIENHNVGYH